MNINKAKQKRCNYRMKVHTYKEHIYYVYYQVKMYVINYNGSMNGKVSYSNKKYAYDQKCKLKNKITDSDSTITTMHENNHFSSLIQICLNLMTSTLLQCFTEFNTTTKIVI